MARYTGPKEKMSRKVGFNLFSKGSRSFSAKAASNRRPYQPGQHGKGKKIIRQSEYGKQLQAKQTIKHIYGLLERQFKKFFEEAHRRTGDTSTNLLTMLELRLDNVIYRAGFADSRSQARQLVNHGHFQINGKNVDIPSLLLKPGDKITLKASKANKTFWKEFKLSVPAEQPSWLQSDLSAKVIQVLTEPLPDDLPKNLRPELVVEIYSR